MNVNSNHQDKTRSFKQDLQRKKLSNIEIKFNHIDNSILVLKDNQSFIKVYNANRSGNVFSDLNKILCLLE